MPDLKESDVLELVLDYLATKGFKESERVLRQEKQRTSGARQATGQQKCLTWL